MDLVVKVKFLNLKHTAKELRRALMEGIDAIKNISLMPEDYTKEELYDTVAIQSHNEGYHYEYFAVEIKDSRVVCESAEDSTTKTFDLTDLYIDELANIAERILTASQWEHNKKNLQSMD